MPAIAPNQKVFSKEALLTANDLLSNDASGIYRTTGKGLRFLDATRKMDGMFALENSNSNQTKEIVHSGYLAT